MTDVVIPSDLWDEDKEAVITTWLAVDGVQVEEGDLLAEIMVEKVQHEIRAPGTGVLSVLRKTDEVIAKGDVIGKII